MSNLTGQHFTIVPTLVTLVGIFRSLSALAEMFGRLPGSARFLADGIPTQIVETDWWEQHTLSLGASAEDVRHIATWLVDLLTLDDHTFRTEAIDEYTRDVAFLLAFAQVREGRFATIGVPWGLTPTELRSLEYLTLGMSEMDRYAVNRIGIALGRVRKAEWNILAVAREARRARLMVRGFGIEVKSKRSEIRATLVSSCQTGLMMQSDVRVLDREMEDRYRSFKQYTRCRSFSVEESFEVDFDRVWLAAMDEGRTWAEGLQPSLPDVAAVRTLSSILSVHMKDPTDWRFAFEQWVQECGHELELKVRVARSLDPWITQRKFGNVEERPTDAHWASCHLIDDLFVGAAKVFPEIRDRGDSVWPRTLVEALTDRFFSTQY